MSPSRLKHDNSIISSDIHNCTSGRERKLRIDPERPFVVAEVQGVSQRVKPGHPLGHALDSRNTKGEPFAVFLALSQYETVDPMPFIIHDHHNTLPDTIYVRDTKKVKYL